MQRHAIIVLDLRRASTRVAMVWADRAETRGESVVFMRGERAVHVLPADHIREVRWFDDKRSAQDELHRIRDEKAGAATFHLEEAVAVAPGRRESPRKGGSAIAESVSTRVVED